jgi:hypothetical protein
VVAHDRSVAGGDPEGRVGLAGSEPAV